MNWDGLNDGLSALVCALQNERRTMLFNRVGVETAGDRCKIHVVWSDPHACGDALSVAYERDFRRDGRLRHFGRPGCQFEDNRCGIRSTCDPIRDPGDGYRLADPRDGSGLEGEGPMGDDCRRASVPGQGHSLGVGRLADGQERCANVHARHEKRKKLGEIAGHRHDARPGVYPKALERASNEAVLLAQFVEGDRPAVRQPDRGD
jgi:hypothetical protein